MIGRYAKLNVYREIFNQEDFFKLAGGAALIPVALMIHALEVSPLAGISLTDVILLISVAVNGFPIVMEALKGLAAREVNVDELVSIAIIACVLNGNFLEAAVVSAIMVLGALVEEAVSDSARDAIKKLVEVTPKTALVERGGKAIELPVEQIRPGDVLPIREGEVIAADGIVLEGRAAIQEASLTGEPLPVKKETGDDVFAGTVCAEGYVKIQAVKVGKDAAIGKIITLVQGAEQSQTTGARIVDRYAAWFTPVILLASLVTFLVTGDINRAITVLIVGCPCSFLLAGPVTTVAAVGRAARSGILVKGGQYLENIAGAKLFCFDKTGTITTGQPVVTEIIPAKGHEADQVLALAAAVERKSLHPLALAIVGHAEKKGLALGDAAGIESEPGIGISGVVDGRNVEIKTSTGSSDRSDTLVDVSIDGIHAAVICLADRPREEASESIRGIREEGPGVAMISGDRDAAVKQVAESVGIDKWFAGQRPEEKLGRLSELGTSGVVYVGDGVNDAPSLKAADTGIAMGFKGAEVALETADVVLMNDTLSQLPFLIRLSRTMSRLIRVNIGLSFLINFLAVGAGALGWLTPVMGAVTHNIGSILVVALAASIRFRKEG
ncbi:MAG: cadmium-translocating P-type ATPase [Desulfobacterales bacterium]|nr:cadmium-translocating P-type ATPase [Desulfobacterales bacterium]